MQHSIGIKSILMFTQSFLLVQGVLFADIPMQQTDQIRRLLLSPSAMHMHHVLPAQPLSTQRVARFRVQYINRIFRAMTARCLGIAACLVASGTVVSIAGYLLLSKVSSDKTHTSSGVLSDHKLAITTARCEQLVRQLLDREQKHPADDHKLLPIAKRIFFKTIEVWVLFLCATQLFGRFMKLTGVMRSWFTWLGNYNEQNLYTWWSNQIMMHMTDFATVLDDKTTHRLRKYYFHRNHIVHAYRMVLYDLEHLLAIMTLHNNVLLKPDIVHLTNTINTIHNLVKTLVRKNVVDEEIRHNVEHAYQHFSDALLLCMQSYQVNNNQ